MTSALFTGVHDRLNRIVADKERVLEAIGAVEIQRRHTTEQLAHQLQQDTKGMTLSRLCALIEEPMATRLEQAGHDLQALIDAWPSLSHETQRAILTLAAKQAKCGAE